MPKQKTNQNGKNVLVAVGIALTLLENFPAGLMQHKLVEQIRKTPGCPYLTNAEGDEVLLQLEEVAGVVKDGNKWRINPKSYNRPEIYPDREGNMPLGSVLATDTVVASSPKEVPMPLAKNKSANQRWDAIKPVAKPIFDAVLSDTGAEGVSKGQLIAFANKGYSELPGLGFDITDGDFVKVLRISVGRAHPEKDDWYVRTKSWNDAHPKKSRPREKEAPVSMGSIEIDLTSTGLPITLTPDGKVAVQSEKPFELVLTIGEHIFEGAWKSLVIGSAGVQKAEKTGKVRTVFDAFGLHLQGNFEIRIITPVGAIEATWHEITLRRD